MARLLAGSWRRSPPRLPLESSELEDALPIVARTNAAPLAWWRLRQTAFAALPEVEALHDAYRYAGLQTQLQESRLSSVLTALREASIEPILLKGWDIARLYPRSELRPYEDIDLIVRPADETTALAAIRSHAVCGAIVDFHHAEISVFDRPDWDGLYDRSRVVDLAGTAVRVLSAEDHLRAICLHGLKHCFSNPIWLCDIAASVEAASADFDWSRCFGSSRPQDQWIGCTLALAHELLGCKLPPEAARSLEPLPRWLVPVVLDTWVRWATVGADERWALRELRNHPGTILKIIARRWPNQLVVALKRKASLTEASPLAQRLYEFGYLFEAKRIVAALSRNAPQRSTP